MFNTYGIFSVNPTTFNNKYGTTYTYPQQTRNTVVTFMKVHNLCLNILGYIPAISLISGSIRIVTGIAMIIGTLTMGKRNADSGVIIRHWYDEAVQTGIAQVTRGALEAFASFGRSLNICLDIAGSFVNVGKIAILVGESSLHAHDANQPYLDPCYPFPLSILSYA